MGPDDRFGEPPAARSEPGPAESPPGQECLWLTTTTPAQTQHVGAVLGRLLAPGDVILLQGPLGAGKTCLTQGIVRGFGLPARVTSPSFTLANVYEAPPGRCPLYHLDLWRIKSAPEALGIGLDEYLDGSGPCVIEWPEVAADVLPREYLRIRFEIVGETRRLEICAIGTRPRALLEQFRTALGESAEMIGGSGAARD
jgi:tRNA threonylcarbamoyladenosine biosynthesis protein TsaE